MKRFVDNIELWLSGAGLGVVWVASVILAPGSGNVWKVAALTAVTVSLLHGIVFWVVRRRQRTIRLSSICEIREMLTDGVLNELTVLQILVPQGARPELDLHVEEIHASVNNISSLVSGLSEESLRAWKDRYLDAEARLAEVCPAYPSEAAVRSRSSEAELMQ